jgi:protein-L-isoaspartate(D-aspartate) O-methyltransferase
MLEAVQLTARDKVLEVGAGSGYVTALLAELTAQVIAMERHSPLAASASALLEKMGYANARIILGDGSEGSPEAAPYDVIVVSAAASEVPQPLLTQLAEGGRMIIPVGAADSQQLQLIHKKDGRLYTSLRELCRFVPLLSGTVIKP